MEWNFLFKLAEAVIIPLTAFLMREIQVCRKDLADYKVCVAQTYATEKHLVRLEVKIDELKDLIIRSKLG